MNHLRVFFVFGLAVALAGCASPSGWQNGHSSAPDTDAPASASGAVVAPPDTVTLRLAEAAEKAATALGSISGIEQNRYGAPPPEDFSMAPAELTAPVTITWVGPVEPFLQMMAARAGYQFRVSGTRPPTTVTVTIDEYQQPLLRLVKSASIQVAGRADVMVDAGRRVMELSYAPVTAGY